MSSIKYIIGIDEAGRGPLAGPVSVAAVAMRGRRLAKQKDSKKLSHKQREEIYKKLIVSSLVARCSLVSEKIIDKHGIVYAVRLGIKRCLRRLNLNPKKCKVLLDGSLRAPSEYKNQKTIIRGDEKIPIIALASIVAKVKRDRRMIKISKKYPKYNFHIHKGYGTRAHYKALRKHGPSEIHRLSFL